MALLRPPSSSLIRRASRSGLIAIKELLVMVVISVCLIGLASQCESTFHAVPAALSKLARASSERYVHQISVTDQELWVHRPREGVIRKNLQSREVWQLPPSYGVEQTKAVFSRDGTTAVLCHSDGMIFRHRIGGELDMRCNPCRTDPINTVCISRDGVVVVCVTYGGRVLGWGRNGTEIGWELPSNATILRTGLGRDGRRMCVMRADGTASFHNSETGTTLGETLEFGTRCVGAVWNDDEQHVAIVSDRGQVLIRDVTSGKNISTGILDAELVHCMTTAIEFSPDGKWLAVTTDTSRKITLWDVFAGRSMGRLVGHEGLIRSISFSPGSDRIYSGSYDGTVREWSLETLSQLRRLD